MVTVANYDAAICGEDIKLTAALARGDFDKTSAELYCSAVFSHPKIANILSQYGLTEKGFKVIALSLINTFPDQSILFGGAPMLVSTLFFFQSERFSALCEDIQQQLGQAWEKEISAKKATEVFGICFSHAERAYAPYFASGKVVPIKQAARMAAPSRQQSGCMCVLGIVIVGLIIFFSCRG
jgi:hypothetical protein